MTRRGRTSCFPRREGDPAPLCATVSRRVGFSDTDPMGIVWFGRYPLFFEVAAEELGLRCGLSYADFFAAGLRGPIVKLDIDYLRPMRLGDEVKVTARLLWDEAAKLITEFAIELPDGTVAATGYTIQIFTEADSMDPLWVSPPMLEKCHERWKAGDFSCLQ
jgi:acyl-CoA thioester hydrolase